MRTIALVNRDGLMVELVDVQEWAEPFRGIDLPVPTARRYRTHTQTTLCGGHICLVLTPNGEIKIFGEGVQLFSFLDGRWHLTDVAWKYDVFENAIGHRDLANRLFSAALNLAEQRRGGLLVVLDDARKVRQLVSARDLLGDPKAAHAGAKDQLHYLLRRRRITELSPLVLETIAQIDGSIVLDREGNLLAFGAILRHRLPGRPRRGDRRWRTYCRRHRRIAVRRQSSRSARVASCRFTKEAATSGRYNSDKARLE